MPLRKKYTQKRKGGTSPSPIRTQSSKRSRYSLQIGKPLLLHKQSPPSTTEINFVKKGESIIDELEEYKELLQQYFHNENRDNRNELKMVNVFLVELKNKVRHIEERYNIEMKYRGY